MIKTVFETSTHRINLTTILSVQKIHVAIHCPAWSTSKNSLIPAFISLCN